MANGLPRLLRTLGERTFLLRSISASVDGCAMTAHALRLQLSHLSKASEKEGSRMSESWKGFLRWRRLPSSRPFPLYQRFCSEYPFPKSSMKIQKDFGRIFAPLIPKCTVLAGCANRSTFPQSVGSCVQVSAPRRPARLFPVPAGKGRMLLQLLSRSPAPEAALAGQ